MIPKWINKKWLLLKLRCNAIAFASQSKMNAKRVQILSLSSNNAKRVSSTALTLTAETCPMKLKFKISQWPALVFARNSKTCANWRQDPQLPSRHAEQLILSALSLSAEVAVSMRLLRRQLSKISQWPALASARSNRICANWRQDPQLPSKHAGPLILSALSLNAEAAEPKSLLRINQSNRNSIQSSDAWIIAKASKMIARRRQLLLLLMKLARMS